MSLTINTARTSQSTLSLVVGDNLCWARVHHAFTISFNDPMIICCVFTPGPPTTQLVFSLLIAIMLTIHQMWPILFLMSICFLVIFCISSMQWSSSAVFTNGWKYSPWNTLKIVFGEIFAKTAWIVSSLAFYYPSISCPVGINSSSLPYKLYTTRIIMRTTFPRRCGHPLKEMLLEPRLKLRHLTHAYYSHPLLKIYSPLCISYRLVDFNPLIIYLLYLRYSHQLTMGIEIASMDKSEVVVIIH